GDALWQTPFAAMGFTNKHLRVLMTGLLGSTAYTPGQMTYDPRRLRLNGLIRRLPHSNRYALTTDGIRIAVFYTKIYNRLLVPLTAANHPHAPPSPPPPPPPPPPPRGPRPPPPPATSTATPTAPACPARHQT